MLTLAEITTYLSIGSKDQPCDSTHIIGMTMPVDEIKIQESMCWDSQTSMILGICQEHGHKCTLEFCSIMQADFMVDCLNAGQAHFGAEMIRLHLTRMNVHIRKLGRHWFVQIRLVISMSASARLHIVRTARMTRSARFARAFSFLSGSQQL